ncbi:hypothetical protein GCM10009104_20610 [Marinobacterium maritimum]|uniref:Dicarboxylate transport n=1 Tax=Marinobacterium maritimum TaxID=500162 RepID=A0ABP3TCJ8_9GAMM
MRKGLIGLLVLAVMLPLLLWLTLPWTAQYLLQQWLQQQGFEQPQLSLQHPSWQQLRIDHISVGQHSDGRRLHLEADNISIRFSPLALLQGHIRELRIEQVRLHVEADASLQGRLNQLEQQTAPVPLDHFNPAQLFRYAPSQRLVIAQLALGYNAPEQPTWQARGNIDLEPDLLQGRFQLFKNEIALGYLDLSLDPTLNLALSLSRHNQYLLRSAHQLTFPKQAWQLRSDLRIDAEHLPDWLRLLQPGLELPITAPSGQLSLNTRLHLPNPLPTNMTELLNSLTLQLGSEVNLAIEAGPDVGRSKIDLQLSAQLNQGQFSLTAAKDSGISTSDLRQPGLRIDSFSASLTEPLQLSGHWQQPDQWQHSDLALALTPQGLQLPQPLELTLQPVQLSVTAGKLVRPQYPLKLSLPDIRLKPEHHPAVNLSVQTELQLDRERRLVSGQARIDSRQLPLHLTLNGHIEDNLKGQIQFQLPNADLKALHTALTPWLPSDLKPLDIVRGSLNVQGTAHIDGSQWSLDARPTIHHADLIWDEHTRVSDINLTQRLRLNSAGQLRSSGQLEIDHTDSGIRVFGPRLDYDLSLPAKGTPRLSLSSFSLSALDGIIAVPPLSFNPLHPVIDTRIAVSTLELERMLELYPQEGLYGSGVLGGALPLKINGSQLSINQGQLVSQGEGGVIRYQPTPEVQLMGQQNPGIQLALSALTDFRFDLLDLTLDYTPSGDAIMKARLKGQNPGWQQGRPVDLNLNIEENLLDLLRTLRLTDNVTDAIDRRFRQ